MELGTPIWVVLERLRDDELIELLPYIRDEEGERMNLMQLRRYLREKRAEYEGGVTKGDIHAE